jgi:hypothetical protein
MHGSSIRKLDVSKYQSRMDCDIEEVLVRTVLQFIVGLGELHQAASGQGHVAVIVESPAVVVVAAVGEVAMRRSQAS